MFLSNTGKVYFEGLVHLLIYIRGNKNLRFKYNADIKYVNLSDLLIQPNIKTYNQFRYFYDSSWQDCPYTGRSIGAYIIFYRGGPIYYGTYVPGTAAK